MTPNPHSVPAVRGAIYLHAGLPRTATTALQSHVFPKLRSFAYLGKESDNRLIPGSFNAVQLTRDAIRAHLAGDAAALPGLRRRMMGLVRLARIANRDKTSEATKWWGTWARCLSMVHAAIGPSSVLYSEESLSESSSGLSATLEFGDAFPLQQLAEIGFMQHVRLCVVLREPVEFLKASYYKAMEIRLASAFEPISFDEYLRRQMILLDRSPPASRLFMCMHGDFTRYLRSLCPQVRVVHYRELLAAPHALDFLLGEETGEAKVSMSQLPRENRTWRDPRVRDMILGAPGVPAGVDIEEYAAGFRDSIQRLSLAAIDLK